MQTEPENKQTEKGCAGIGIPYFFFCPADSDGTASNIGALLRDREHDRLLSACRWRSKSDRAEVPLSALSDYEYFRLYADCFLGADAATGTGMPPEPGADAGKRADFKSETAFLTDTEQTDHAFLNTLLGHPVCPCNDNSDFEALWAECNRAIDAKFLEKAENTETNHTDVYCYSADFSLWDEAETMKRWGRVPPIPGRSLMMIRERMPAVFRRPDPHHASLAYRKLTAGTATPEEVDLLYAQVLRTAARFCAKAGIPLYLSSVSPDLTSFLAYIKEQAGNIRVLAAVNEVSVRYLPAHVSLLFRPVVSDAETAVRLASEYPLRELIWFPEIGGTAFTEAAVPAASAASGIPAADANFFPEYAVAAQGCFRRTLAERIRQTKKTHGWENLLRAVCYENLISFLTR